MSINSQQRALIMKYFLLYVKMNVNNNKTKTRQFFI